MNSNKKILIFFLFTAFMLSCKEVYLPRVVEQPTAYLVVEGFINSGAEPSSLVLTRTTNIYDSTQLVYEHNAAVTIESSANESYPMNEQGDTVYVSTPLTLNANNLYRIHIKTSDGKEYISDFSKIRHTPPIDSISWRIENGGVQIYANTHDETVDTGYYRWSYSETWEFHSTFTKTLEYTRDPLTGIATGVEIIPADTSIYKCWKTQASHQLILGSSEKLTANRMYQPLRYIEPQSYELSVLYYMDLKQYSLSKDAYSFNQKLKGNTEQLGTIFDPQPSSIDGNIHCVNDPKAMAIGFVEVSQEQEKKIFIHHDDLPIFWLPHLQCELVAVTNTPGALPTELIPISAKDYSGFTIKSFWAALPICADCTLRGTNTKPSFWP